MTIVYGDGIRSVHTLLSFVQLRGRCKHRNSKPAYYNVQIVCVLLGLLGVLSTALSRQDFGLSSKSFQLDAHPGLVCGCAVIALEGRSVAMRLHIEGEPRATATGDRRAWYTGARLH